MKPKTISIDIKLHGLSWPRVNLSTWGGIEGVCTLQWPYYIDVTMAVFHVFPRYKKINKIKFIEIIEKGTNLSKAIIINLPRMKKSN